MRGLIVFCLGLLLVGSCVGKESTAFDNTRVYKVNVEDATQLKELKKLAQELQLPIIKIADAAPCTCDIVVNPEQHTKFEDRLNVLGLSFDVMIPNLKKALDGRQATVPEPKMEWTQYHTLDQINEWLDFISLKHQNFIKRYTIGNSYEGRPIKALKLSRKRGNKAIFVESNIHAVEWISSAAGTCFLNNLLNSQDPEVRLLTWNYDWIFVPVLNPDGFEYTHNKSPLWRKSRKPTGFSNSSGICYGTDMNRNFDYEWNVSGYNIDVPCDHWYGGSAAETEPEVQALIKFVNSFPEGYIRMYLALHSYGNMLLLPYGQTNLKFPENYGQMLKIAMAWAESVSKQFGTKYTYGASGLLNYPVSGSSKDWAYGVKKIPFTATIELRDKGKYGFFLPAEEIKEVCAEITDGFVGMLKAAKKEKLFD